MKITAFKNHNLTILSLSLGLIFFGFNAAEQHFTAFYQSIGLPNLAFQSLAVLYGAIIVGNFIGPSIVKKLGVELSFFLGYLAYVFLVFGITLKISILIYALSFLLGVGSGIVGIAGAEFLRLVAPKDKRGEFSSATEMVRIFGGFSGIFLVSLILRFISINKIFLLLGTIMLSGILLLLALKKSPKDLYQASSTKQDIKAQVLFLKNPKVLLLLPKSIAGGFLLGLILGAIPVIIEKNYGIGWVGIITSLWHITIASFILWAGYLSDIKGRFGLIYTSLIIPVVAAVIFLNFQSLPILAAVMILLGLGDSLGKGASTALMLDTFEDKIKEASAVLGNLGLVLGVVPSFLLPQILNQSQLFILAILLNVLGIFTLWIFQLKFSPAKRAFS